MSQVEHRHSIELDTGTELIRNEKESKSPASRVSAPNYAIFDPCLDVSTNQYTSSRHLLTGSKFVALQVVTGSSFENWLAGVNLYN